MGCSSCSTTSNGTDAAPSGCGNNGTCGTSGCNKLNVYNWLSDMVLPEGHKPFDILEVRFKGSRKEFFRNTNNLTLKVGDWVAVEGNPGHDIGEVSLIGELVRFQLRKKGVKEDSHEIKALYRIARQTDIEKYTEVKNLEHSTMHRSRTIALALGLKMKLSDVEYQGDGKKATFFYTADERVDFRELIRKLADEFKVRIEMRQIGMRQEAARLGGIGSCGRELCCSTWLTDFKIVSTSAARYQNLSLNPIKLAGQCGKLKCCLNYELDTYLDALKDIPETNVKLFTAKGMMVHRKTDIFKRILWYSLIPEPKEGEDRPFFGGADNWIPMSADRVKEIMALNKQNVKPEDAGQLEFEEEEDLGYDDVVGQDSLTRMDRAKKKKKKKPDAQKGGVKAGEAGAAARQQKQQQTPTARPQSNQPQQQRSQQNPQQRPPSNQPQPAKPQQQRPQQNPQQARPQQNPQQAKPQQNNSNPTNRPPRQAPAQNAGGNTPPPAPKTSALNPQSGERTRPERKRPQDGANGNA
jgi:cell fate regulator YaaT (PSP1 superfamily)